MSLITSPLTAAGRLLVTCGTRGPLGIGRALHSSATAGAAVALPGAVATQEQQVSSRQGQSSSSSSSSSTSGSSGGGSKWARLWPLGAAGASLLALGLYGGNLVWQAVKWTQADNYSPIAPSYTLEGLKGALAHNEREARKQRASFLEGQTFIDSLVGRAVMEYTDVHGNIRINRTISAWVEKVPNDLLAFNGSCLAHAAAAGVHITREDRVRYLEVFEVVKANRELMSAALRREQEQLSALLPLSLNFEPLSLSFTIRFAFFNRANACLAALEREYRQLSAERDRIIPALGSTSAALTTSTSISTSTSSSAPDNELLAAASRARQRDIKLARNQAMLVAYRKQQEVLEAILGPLFVPGPTVPKRSFQAVMERTKAQREASRNVVEAAAAALATLPDPSSSGSSSSSLDGELREWAEELRSRYSNNMWSVWAELALFFWIFAELSWWRPIDEWAARAVAARTAAQIEALEREREQLLASE